MLDGLAKSLRGHEGCLRGDVAVRIGIHRCHVEMQRQILDGLEHFAVTLRDAIVAKIMACCCWDRSIIGEVVWVWARTSWMKVAIGPGAGIALGISLKRRHGELAWVRRTMPPLSSLAIDLGRRSSISLHPIRDVLTLVHAAILRCVIATCSNIPSRFGGLASILVEAASETHDSIFQLSDSQR